MGKRIIVRQTGARSCLVCYRRSDFQGEGETFMMFKNLVNIGLFLVLVAIFQSTAIAESDNVDPGVIRTTIFTPQGTPLDAMIISESMLPAQDSNLDDPWSKTIQSKDGQIVSAPTNTYNGHGYTWFMSEGGQQHVWIENPQPYLVDGSYQQLTADEAREGDKVLYGDGVHSAVVADEPGWVISKWGEGPLVKHRLRDLPPALGPDAVLRFYRKVTIPSPPTNVRIVHVGAN